MAFILTFGVDDTTTELPVVNVDFPSNGGIIQIESEKILYTYISDYKIYGCTRGYDGTTAAAHLADTPVSFVSATILSNSVGGTRITDVADPLNAQDAATKAYVDSLAVAPVIPPSTTRYSEAQTGAAITSNTYVSILSDTFAVSAATKKVKVTFCGVYQNGSPNDSMFSATLYVDGVDVATQAYGLVAADVTQDSLSFQVLHTPGDTASHTYSVMGKNFDGITSMTIPTGYSPVTMILEEVA